MPPARKPGWACNPIDAFLASRHEAKGITPNAEASRRILLRRLSLDLTGLPPTPEEVDAFANDTRPDAWERQVDRLLASPAHGERWGRHWLDLARWAESEGYESNHVRNHAWRYRDYVVGSFNRDRPFADFVRQQLAGDEVQPYSDENLIATGFLAAARLSSNEEDKPRQRNDVLVDVVNATAGTFLGLTFHCAQCHNHKFDALTARDYYRFQAFFAGGQPGNLVLLDRELWRKYEAARPSGYEAARAEKEALLEAARETLVREARKSLSKEMQRALDVPEERRTPEEERLAREAELRFEFTPGRIERAVPDAERKRYEALKKRLAEMEKRMLDRPQTWGFYAPAGAARAVEVLPMKGFYPLAFEPARLRRMKAHLLVVGDVHRRGAALEPGWPAVFGPTPPLGSALRLALADWLTSPGNPLAARVYVNRVWGWHFGRGLVATPSDFGVKGARPSHPELLDWLASEFVRSGGSTKHLHRLIVTSRAYRLASTPSAENSAIDAENALVWRWRPRRLEAEAVRDSLLAVSGDLDRRPGGRGDEDEIKSGRRGLYLFQRRDKPPALQGLFDGPVASAESCPRRQTSTVPLSALFLLNNEFSVARAKGLARRVAERAGADRERQVGEAYRLVLGRLPDEEERAAVRRLFAAVKGEGRALEALCQAMLNLNEFLYLE